MMTLEIINVCSQYKEDLYVLFVLEFILNIMDCIEPWRMHIKYPTKISVQRTKQVIMLACNI